MGNKKLDWGVPEWIVVAGVLIIVAVLVLIDARDLGSMQSIVVLISAVAAAVVTYLLLQGQKHDLDKQRKQDKLDADDRRKQEHDWQDERRKADKEFEQRMANEDAKRTKDARIYSNKIAAFSAFNKAVWQENMDTRDNDRETIINIRKELFSRVILYLSAGEINQIIAAISGQEKQFPYVLSSIVNILNQNAERTLTGNDKNEDNEFLLNTTDADFFTLNDNFINSR